MRVEARWDRSGWVRFRDRYLTVSVCQAGPPAPPPAPAAKRRAPARRHSGGNWMKGFNLPKSLPLWQILRQEQGGAAAPGRER